MSTNSSIAVCLADGSVISIYCHYDGFIHYNGRLLLEYWNSQELAESLVSLGNISVLGQLKPIGKHTFNNPEIGVNANVWKSLIDYFENCDFRDYNYLFVNDNWLVSSELEFGDNDLRVLSVTYKGK